MASLTETNIKDLSAALSEDIIDCLRSTLEIDVVAARRIGRVVAALFERELRKLGAFSFTEGEECDGE